MTTGMDIKMCIFDIFKNPTMGNVSHLRLWANAACVAGTFKFVMLPDPSAGIWVVYPGIIGGYVVMRPFVSVKWQELESDHARETD